ncbi:MAG: alpha/beta fold hydrolase [Acidimicrobiales bacterium]
MTEPDDAPDAAVTYTGAVAPARRRTVDAAGIALQVYEWGDADDPPLLLAHGGFDFARTFDVFAPLLAAGGWRVVSWDHRGHGESSHAAMYSWDADMRDALAVLDSVTREPVPVVGHSKGGALMLQLIEAQPHRFSCLVNIDGLPSPRPHPDIASHERTKLLASDLANWLDYRRGAAGLERKPGTIDDLATRRGRMNPRLSHEWLRYLVSVGARHDADGWRWTIDPALRMGGFGPWRNIWSIERLPGFPVPLLGFLGLEQEQMGWGTEPDELRPYMPRGAHLEVVADTGHFVHIERPTEVAELCLSFLGGQ